MGKKRNTKKSKRAITLNKRGKSNKKTVKLDNSIKSQTHKRTIKTKSDNVKNKVSLPVTLPVEYCNLVGVSYPRSQQDINDIIDILLIQYNRIIKSEQTDLNIVRNIKVVCKTLTKIFVYYTNDTELQKLLKVIELVDDANDNNIGFLKKELDIIYSQIRSNEHKYST